MSINIIFGVSLSLFFIYLFYSSVKPDTSKPQRFGLLVAQDTGKSKINQSKTGDASLFIQKVRRKAIRTSGAPIKETHTQFGSTTGAIETYFVNE
jgi:hypothetical protein